MEKRILIVDVGANKHELKKLEDAKLLGVVDYGVKRNFEERTYENDVLSSENPFIFGIGPLSGSKIPGTHRLVFIACSPLLRTLFLSTLGGAGIPLYRTGIELVEINGKAENPSILLLRNVNGDLEVELHGLEQQELMKIYGSGKEEGVYSLQTYLIEKFYNKCQLDGTTFDFRILTVGPAALTTNFAGLNSLLIRNCKIVPGAEGWAGRGGFGSTLAQAHNVVAIIYGGNQNFREFPGENLKDIEVVDRIFKEKFGKRMMEMATEATEKYRYVKALETGGTFGVNFHDLEAWTPMLNWSMIYLPHEKRKEFWTKLILNHYLKQFNEEIIQTKSWKTCGEACPGLCKKVYGHRKKDYEQYEALGPNCGIFDHRAAEKLALTVEGMGFDAISFGQTLSFILECMQKGPLTKDDIGEHEEPNFDFATISLTDSEVHARIGSKIAKDIAYGKTDFSRIFKNGLREACRELEKKYGKMEEKLGIKFRDFANYVAFGNRGEITPCQYWVPGFYIPLPIQGKFFTYYGLDFRPPRELGKIAAERSIKELYSENMGLCRFHRKWSEELVEELVNRGYGLNVNFYAHHKGLLQRILDYNAKASAKPVYWETRRVKDIIKTYIAETIAVFGGSEESRAWSARFSKDEEKAAWDYWRALLDGVNDVVSWGA